MEKKHDERKIKVQNEINKNEECQFQINEINQLTKELKLEFKIQGDEVEDEQLLQMKKDMKENNSKLDRLSSRIKDLLSLTQTWDLEHEEVIKKISADYQHVTAKKNEYCTLIKRTMQQKTADKRRNIQDIKPEHQITEV